MAGLPGSKSLDFQRHRMIVHRAGNVIAQPVEALGGCHPDGTKKRLLASPLGLRNSNVGDQLQTANFNDVGGMHRE